ncbi:MAG TPA: metal ABC transporter permease [Candidatus Hydrogenedentes bacterium]|nr:metal ABC transporter permease [Candidatus Hydrogenedentota bacterium]HPG66753.1 metal ABC transporter permease [Candidatus Hydrogenedentota bacterium]
MGEFVRALANPDIPFLRYALLTGIMASVAFGIIGTYVVTRRITYIAGAIAHSVLAGIGAALYLRQACGLAWFTPMMGAVAAAILSALIIGVVGFHTRQREDTVIGAVWAIGMATGLLFIAKTPGYIQPMSYLFGDILMISRSELGWVVAIDAMVVIVALVCYNKLLAVCFDEEFARLRGVHVEAYYYLLLCLTALTVVLLVLVVGIVMVIALLTLPPAVAGQCSKRVWQMMLLSAILCAAFTTTGLGVSYVYDLPSGPTIILVGGLAYLVAMAARRLNAR